MAVEDDGGQLSQLKCRSNKEWATKDLIVRAWAWAGIALLLAGLSLDGGAGAGFAFCTAARIEHTSPCGRFIDAGIETFFAGCVSGRKKTPC